MKRRFLSIAAAGALLAAGLGFAPAAQAAGDIDLCVTVGRNAGFTGENFVTAVAVAMAESRCDPLARGVNEGSVDRGLWQINDFYHPEVSDACAYDAQCNANAAYRISESGNDWTQWATYNSGSYRQFLDEARAAIGAPSPAPRAAKSVNGDKYDDALGIDGNGVAWVYPSKSGGGFGTGVRIGGGWSGFSAVAVNDSNADGLADLFAIKAGTLSYWNNRGDGSFSGAVTVGQGWSGFEYVAFGDVNGDNKADILARDGGKMYLYIGKGGGRFAGRSFVGEGWASLTRHTVADADGDGDGDIWATNAAGELFFWKRTDDGYATAVQVGSGWTAFRHLVSMDVNGNNRADLVAVRTSDNTLWQWLGTGSGTFSQATKIGSGWASYTLAAN
ncbi:FG-GAP-like repeat-containing protein [Amycolatopsis sp. NPDC052450]|uniref:FG-GAP-like repeat-containing protein n=1 Tax=Amycolatopsis sp. NPDC052450 TaxID=3363937 RepID=UPI0037CABF93